MQKKLLPLYRLFETNKIVMIPDYTAFCREHPDFDLPLGNVRNAICGHLVTAGKSIGFIMILNVSTEYFSRADFILSTLNDFLAVMIQNRSKIEEAIEQSQRDPMTGVRNRAGLRKYLEKQSGEGPVAIISGDINGLKVMNDSQGHLSGDRLILGIAAILVRFADADHVFRMGGDEFLVIREGMDDAGARELIRQIRHTCLAEGFSIAMGYTIHSGSIDNIDDVLKKADQSMYEDKGRYYHRESGAVISGQHKDLPEE